MNINTCYKINKNKIIEQRMNLIIIKLLYKIQKKSPKEKKKI